MEFVDNSKMAKRVIEKQAIKALLKICQLVEGQAVLLAPVNMGGLRDSIGLRSMSQS
ncbi:hypothetical protein [Streptococcus parauberis]|uniref:hypothetical protein n=1 Tax=Streptococcus parauberis TaxID=1348 RepID=UPI0007A89B9E|nr:hypothetical protein AKL13_00379 [Streptococcus parauberis]